MMEKFSVADTLATIVSNKESMDDGTIIMCNETKKLYIKMNNKITEITLAKREINKPEIKQLKCKSCGAPLTIPEVGSITTCKFCRSVYDINGYNIDVF